MNDEQGARAERIWLFLSASCPQSPCGEGRLWLNIGSCIRLSLQDSEYVCSHDYTAERTHPGLRREQAIGGHRNC